MISRLFTITNLLLLLSASAFVLAIYSFYVSWVTLSWPETTGQIYYIDNSIKGHISSHKQPVLTTNITKASYSYVVKGQGFDGRAPINKSNNYNINDKIAVYYNPNNPKQSTINNDLNWTYFSSFLALSIILFLSSIAWNNKVKALTSRSTGP